MFKTILGRFLKRGGTHPAAPAPDPGLYRLVWSLALFASGPEGEPFVMLSQALGAERLAFRCFRPVAVGQRYRLDAELSPEGQLQLHGVVRSVFKSGSSYQGELLLELDPATRQRLLEILASRSEKTA
ncbi:MAG: hypothetical protein HY319_08600 [Armatimonadetes bacterium]|nr:hypothetical protein [Armatimonadota bacterium]